MKIHLFAMLCLQKFTLSLIAIYLSPKDFVNFLGFFLVKVSTVLSRGTHSIDAYHECNK